MQREPHPDDEFVSLLSTISSYAQHTQPQHTHLSEAHHINNVFTCFWNSSKAKNFSVLFCSVGNDKEMKVEDVMCNRIVKLRSVALTNNGWKNVLDDGNINNHERGVAS